MIALRLEVEKNINELTSDEVKSIIWTELYSEQYEYVDVNVYRKLNAVGRLAVNRVIDDYSSRPIEYWNEVFKYKLDPYFINKILRTSKNPIEVYSNHKAAFDNNEIPCTFFKYGIMSFADFVRNEGIEAVTNAHSYNIMLDPKIPIAQYNEKYNDKMTIIQFIKKELDDQWVTDEYPILLPNEVLLAGGYSSIPDFNDATLNAAGACEDGRSVLKPWIESLGKNGVLSWDTVVAYLRENPEQFESVEEYLEWWWNNNV